MVRVILLFQRSAAALLIVVLALAGCGGPLSVASSMRVEVEVYKGPLTKEPEVQWGELIGIVDEAREMLKKYELGLRQVLMPFKECPDWKPYKALPETKSVNPYPPDTEKYISKDWTATACLHLNGLSRDVEALQEIYNQMAMPDFTPTRGKTLARYLEPSEKKIGIFLVELTRIANSLKTNAIYWANVHAAAAPDSLVVRNAMTNFSNMSAQISNQLASRADALLKQGVGKQGDGTWRKNLPLSVYLRDTSITDFPNLYSWNRAAAPALLAEMFLHPINAFSSEETTDRIRVLERLFADHYWTNINTVYASGQGTVRMALIKDDIGNWNLKSFDNNPAKLLNAYKEMTLAAVKAVADDATGEKGKALDLVSRLTRGRIGTEGVKAGAFNVEALRQRTVQNLEKLRDDTKAQEAKLKPQDRKSFRANTLKEARHIVENYEAVIDVLQESATAKSPKP